MADLIKGCLMTITAIIKKVRLVFLTTISGRGFMCDRINGQVVCPRCYSHGNISHMAYDGHLEIPHKQGIPGCASDRFLCLTCFYNFTTVGRVGKTLNRKNHFGILTLDNLKRYCTIKTRRWWRICKSKKRSCV